MVAQCGHQQFGAPAGIRVVGHLPHGFPDHWAELFGLGVERHLATFDFSQHLGAEGFKGLDAHLLRHRSRHANFLQRAAQGRTGRVGIGERQNLLGPRPPGPGLGHAQGQHRGFGRPRIGFHDGHPRRTNLYRQLLRCWRDGFGDEMRDGFGGGHGGDILAQ